MANVRRAPTAMARAATRTTAPPPALPTAPQRVPIHTASPAPGGETMANQMAALRDLTRYRLGFRIAVAAATIGVIYGYDLGNISGALLFITQEFDLSTKQTEWVATIVVAGSIAGALAASRVANAIGRKPTMMLVALTYAA